MTAPDDVRLDGRHPEFARMSNRPGIGHGMMHEVASQLMHFNLEDAQADVPSALRHGKRELPLGRYLTRSLRKMVGRDEKAPQAVIDQQQSEVQALRTFAFDNSRSFSDVLKMDRQQGTKNFEVRQKILGKRKKL